MSSPFGLDGGGIAQYEAIMRGPNTSPGAWDRMEAHLDGLSWMDYAITDRTYSRSTACLYWAAAQQIWLKALYDKVLQHIAFTMINEGVTVLPKARAIELINEILNQKDK